MTRGSHVVSFDVHSPMTHIIKYCILVCFMLNNCRYNDGPGRIEYFLRLSAIKNNDQKTASKIFNEVLSFYFSLSSDFVVVQRAKQKG